MIDGLKHFRYRGTDVIVFHVLDHDELKFPFERAARFRDIETADEVVAVPAAVRDDYLAAVGRADRRLPRGARRRRHRLLPARHVAAARARADART